MIFRWHVTLFSPETHFFLAFPCTSPRFGHFFERSHPLFSPRSFFFHSVNAFPIRASLILHALHHLHLPIYALSAPHSPRPSRPSPLSFSFLPTFPSPSPINERSRAPSRNTRVRVRPHIPTRQEVFVYCLHLFTHPSQSAVHQRVKGEGKQEKAFTKHITISKSTSYHKFPISSTMNSIYQRGEPHLTIP